MKNLNLLAVLCLSLVAASSQAIIVSVGGTASLIAAPADARLDALTGSDIVPVWDETQGFTLTSNLKVDAVSSGTYTVASDLPVVQPEISAGSVVNSHYIHFDSPASNAAAAVGSVTFGEDILGVIVMGDSNGTPKTLDLSDYLASGTLHDDNLNHRGLELDSSDWFGISADRRTLNYGFAITQPGDRIRVVTAPEPVSILGMVAGIGMLVNSRRRKSA